MKIIDIVIDCMTFEQMQQAAQYFSGRRNRTAQGFYTKAIKMEYDWNSTLWMNVVRIREQRYAYRSRNN